MNALETRLDHLRTEHGVHMIVATMERLESISVRLRETSEGLRQWWQNFAHDKTDGPEGVHPLHAANRLLRMADEINAAGREETAT